MRRGVGLESQGGVIRGDPREHEFGAGTIQGVARKLGVHRRMVREAIQSAMPARRKKTERPSLKMAAAAALIEAILEADRKAPRKQRHTARRIYDRIRVEVPGCTAAERTVRQYVEQRKHALGLSHHETLVPQSYAWGVKPKRIGMKPMPIWAESGNPCHGRAHPWAASSAMRA